MIQDDDVECRADVFPDHPEWNIKCNMGPHKGNAHAHWSIPECGNVLVPDNPNVPHCNMEKGHAGGCGILVKKDVS